ncbi:hypothetical protein JTB14_015417 [Gonioctena quinquepunctata]|nr:hypothetical protein JTB14_015417 [Gonioctena quinquepunctata]
MKKTIMKKRSPRIFLNKKLYLTLPEDVADQDLTEPVRRKGFKNNIKAQLEWRTVQNNQRTSFNQSILFLLKKDNTERRRDEEITCREFKKLEKFIDLYRCSVDEFNECKVEDEVRIEISSYPISIEEYFRGIDEHLESRIAGCLARPDENNIPVKILNVRDEEVLLKNFNPQIGRIEDYELSQFNDDKTNSGITENVPIAIIRMKIGRNTKPKIISGGIAEPRQRMLSGLVRKAAVTYLIPTFCIGSTVFSRLRRVEE